MRRTLVCCALLTVAVAACSSGVSSANPYQPPVQHPYPTSAASMAPYQPPVYQPPANQPPAYQPPAVTIAPQYPYPPVTFPSLGVNPYVDTQRDHVSTFGLDVDTASYTVARSYVRQGLRPDPSSVRPEEWVNFFDQGYPAPETGTFAILADGAPTPFLSPGEVLLRVGVKARESSERRGPMALTFVIDVSGSMADGGRLELVKQSLAMLVSQLRDDDRVAIVAFSTKARVVLDCVTARDRDRIYGAIGGLRPEDTTNAEAGIRLGYQLARAQRVEGGINRVVLATDGVANVGSTDASRMLDDVGADAPSGIQLVAVGVGMGNYNDALLEKLADRGEGFYAYVDSPEEAHRIFVEKLTTTLDTVALDAKAQVDFNQAAVAGYRLIGYEDRGLPDQSFRDPNAKGGAIGAGHQVTALYAVVLRPGEGRDERIATIDLRWTDPSSKGAQEIVRDVTRGDVGGSFASTDAHFKLDALVAATAEVLRGSPWIPGYRLDDLRGAAAALSGQLPPTDEARDFLELIDRLGSVAR